MPISSEPITNPVAARACSSSRRKKCGRERGRCFLDSHG
jgi:hypothetical protein